ncbi:unnamed protein product [Ilex paraguariensis]|uniref:Surfeit locus protein 2 n=1 Tax=Ilex paraguariensis TaxID=185542 RepID=A0ABC8SX21_9AQUA
MAKKEEDGDVPKKKEEDGDENKDKEGNNLLGPPTFKKLENGRFKCVETGHELPSHARDSYAQSKHCRLGLIDAALARNKPPLNMFQQDPQSRSKLICKLTGVTINKSEEHIWKHINGRKFLIMLEKKEAEKQTPNGMIGEQNEVAQEKKSKPKADGAKKRKNKKEKNVGQIAQEARDSSDKESDLGEAEFWMPRVGERWDFEDGGDRWGSGSEVAPETDGGDGEDGATEDCNNNSKELSKRTKRMSIEIGPSSFASRKKKKKKTTSTK